LTTPWRNWTALSWRSAGLTEREVDAPRLVAIGLSNDDIARA
jgi:DNA-binding CsgD family transcriptional regulator